MKINTLLLALLALGAAQTVTALTMTGFNEPAEIQLEGMKVGNNIETMPHTVQEPAQISVAPQVPTPAAATRAELQKQLTTINQEIKKLYAEFTQKRVAATAPLMQEINALYAKQRAAVQPLEADLQKALAPLRAQQAQVMQALRGLNGNKLKGPRINKPRTILQPGFVGGLGSVAPEYQMAPEFTVGNAAMSNAVREPVQTASETMMP